MLPSKAWMYLQPIFDSPDIMKQLPTEGLRCDIVFGVQSFELRVTCFKLALCEARSSAWSTASGARPLWRTFGSPGFLICFDWQHCLGFIYALKSMFFLTGNWQWPFQSLARPWLGFIRMVLLCKLAQWPGSWEFALRLLYRNILKRQIRAKMRWPMTIHDPWSMCKEGLLETWNNANADLDMVQKGAARDSFSGIQNASKSNSNTHSTSLKQVWTTTWKPSVEHLLASISSPMPWAYSCASIRWYMVIPSYNIGYCMIFLIKYLQNF